MPWPPNTPGIQLADHFTLIAHFVSTFANIPPWRSSFEIENTAGVTPQPNDPIIEACEEYWIANLRDDCQLDHLELRQWSRGPQPFAAQPPIWTDPVQLNGQKVANYGAQGQFAVGREVAAFIRIANSGPKQGKQFLRQLFDLSDIACFAGGNWEFIVPGPPNVTPAKFQTTLTQSTLATYLRQATPAIRTVHFSLKQFIAHGALPFSSQVTSLALVGPTVNKPTRKNKK